ncbi:MAG: serine/threonine protein kinase [Planctomycetota bacterium]|nr:serine/threonine protein kinase [Planctomycetaceae bacterium]MDQ3331763.1 serine/threonine protein kinase [Planctomycetota bacterium]
MIALSAKRASVLKVRQKLGKYRVERRLADGGFAAVYEATDTIEGIKVALKIPHQSAVNPAMLSHFRREVRLIARLEHPNILPLKDASFIGDQFVIAFPLGERTLSDRLRRRLSVEKALDFGEQLLQGVAYAHRHRIIHCDIKPENVILFPGERLRLTDFGIAKIAQKTIRGSGTGTVGYMAPEQAMGRPSARSDVFSSGVILYRMLAGHWPEWPFQWPLAGSSTLRRKVHPDLMEVLRRSLSIDPKRRFADADQMLRTFLPASRKTIRLTEDRRRRRQVTG